MSVSFTLLQEDIVTFSRKDLKNDIKVNTRIKETELWGQVKIIATRKTSLSCMLWAVFVLGIIDNATSYIEGQRYSSGLIKAN